MFTIYMISRIGADVNFSAMTWSANTGPSLPTFAKNWKNSNSILKTCNLSSLAGMEKLTWCCQILFSGHWLKGACMTTGETTEQTNSKMAIMVVSQSTWVDPTVAII